MSLDVSAEIEIERPPGIVAAYACNPENAPDWSSHIKSVQWITEPKVHRGSRIAVVAELLGKRLEYTSEIVEYEPGKNFVMRATEGQFVLETTYRFEPTRDGHTRMTLRNRGEASGVSKLLTPVVTAAIKTAAQRDLLKLKEVLEGHD